MIGQNPFSGYRPADYNDRITSLEDTYVNFEYWEEISSGTTGTITPPTGASFVLDQWPGDVDAVVSTVDTGNVPDGELSYTAGGVAITTTLTSGGAYVLSGTPSSYPVAIIYAARVKLSDFDDTKVLGQPGFYRHVKADGEAGGQTINGGTGAGEALNLYGTSHATPGPINFNGEASLDSSGNATGTGIQANVQTGTSYTLVLADKGKLVTLDNASAIALTIPANASVAYPVGTIINLLQLGAGQVTVGITSDTLLSKDSLVSLTAQYSAATLYKKTATTWVLFGDLA